MDEFSKPLAGSIAAEDSVSGIEGEVDAISEAELQEFLAADALGAPADPAFKRSLQVRLWEIVQARLQKKRRHTWMHGWRRRDVPPADETDDAAEAKPRREPA